MEKGNEIVWLGLESNPDMMNAFAEKLGLDISKHSFGDIFGLTEDLICMIPQPLLAIILLFPGNCKVGFDESKKGDDTNSFFLHQPDALEDACGTIALIHAISNNLDTVSLNDGPLKTYINDYKLKTPQERGTGLALNKALNVIHNSFVENEINDIFHVHSNQKDRQVFAQAFEFYGNQLWLVNVHAVFTSYFLPKRLTHQSDHTSLISTIAGAIMLLGDFNLAPEQQTFPDDFLVLTPSCPTTAGGDCFDYAAIFPFDYFQQGDDFKNFKPDCLSFKISKIPSSLELNREISNHKMISYYFEVIEK